MQRFARLVFSAARKVCAGKSVTIREKRGIENSVKIQYKKTRKTKTQEKLKERQRVRACESKREIENKYLRCLRVGVRQCVCVCKSRRSKRNDEKQAQQQQHTADFLSFLPALHCSTNNSYNRKRCEIQ